MYTKRSLRLVLLVALLALSVSTLGQVKAQDKVELRYGLWDANQVPPYQACADAFTKANPNITVKLEQLSWDDYWNGISSGFAAGTTPDVFTNHLAKYPDFIKLDQIVDIQPMVDRDKVATDIYYPGLADLWTKDGKRYGLPKDWDTVAVVYNADMLKAAGIDPAIMKTWTWNPKDGGDFEKVIAQLTLDKNGKNGLDKDFDKANVVQYGFTNSTNWGAYGQTEWSMFAVSNGFKFNDGPWATKYYYDDPKLAETIQWMASLLQKGFMSPYDSKLGRDATFEAKKAAMGIDGSWMIGTYVGSKFPAGFGRLPIGPNGRKSMFNGLADSIYKGTTHLEESWKLVKFLASSDCETIVGQSGVVFPAIPDAAKLSLKVREDKGIDVSAFVDQANEKDGTFLFPITDNAGAIGDIMKTAMDNIAFGKADAVSALKKANDDVNKLFQ